MGTAKSREFKINWLSSKIHAADIQGVSLNKEKLLNEFCLATSSTIRTAAEILEILIKTNAAFEIEADILGPVLYREVSLKNHNDPSEELDAALSAVPVE